MSRAERKAILALSASDLEMCKDFETGLISLGLSRKLEATPASAYTGTCQHLLVLG